ncbi:hypothetical protein ABPG72_002098 [Tetrahymena utriculariae]
MSSKKNGLIGRLLKIKPQLLHIHCRAHVANLGLSDLFPQYSILQDYYKLIKKICSLFNNKKSNNQNVFLSVQEQIILENNIEQNQTSNSKLIKPLDVRWISYLPAIERLIQQYQPISISLKKLNTVKSNSYYNQITNLQFIFFMINYKNILKYSHSGIQNLLIWSYLVLNIQHQVSSNEEISRLDYFSVYIYLHLQKEELNLVILNDSLTMCLKNLTDIYDKIEDKINDFKKELTKNNEQFYCFKSIPICKCDDAQIDEELTETLSFDTNLCLSREDIFNGKHNQKQNKKFVKNKHSQYDNDGRLQW